MGRTWLCSAMGFMVALLGGCSDGSAVIEGETDGEGTGSTGSTTTAGGQVTITTTAGATTASGTADSGGVTSSNDATGSPTGGGGGGCCEIHDGPGCDEPDVETCVCGRDPSCCVFAWDQVCVDAATDVCEASCMAATTGDPTGGTTTGGADSEGECAPVQIELDSADAVLSGQWMVVMSQAGEGEVLYLPAPSTDGSVLWEPDIPCQDTWYIWVRYFDQGTDDSYFVTLDGQPRPAPVFEGDCTQAGDGYRWNLLNWRDPENGGLCEYVEDPWTADWGPGIHEIAFSYREARALGRIIVTNDPGFDPGG